MIKNSFFYAVCICLVPSCVTFQSVHKYDGIWKSQGYSFYLNIEDSIVERYQYTSVSCFKASGGYLPKVTIVDENYINIVSEIHLNSSTRMSIRRPQDVNFVVLDKISSLPNVCSSEPVNTALMNVEIVWRSIYENYAYFNESGREEWRKLYKQFQKKSNDIDSRIYLNSQEEKVEVYYLIESLLAQIEDGHSFLYAPDIPILSFPNLSKKTDKINLYEETDIVDEFNQLIGISYCEDELTTNANAKIFHCRLNGGAYYISISSLGGFSEIDLYGKESNKALVAGLGNIGAQLRAKESIIIDLRFNNGGSIPFANIIASFFSGRRYVSSFLQTKLNMNDSAGFTSKQVVGYSLGNKTSEIKRKIYVLTSDYTASAAEYLTANFRENGATLIGENTRGVFSPVLLRSLPNGWFYSISNQKMTLKNGKVIEKLGVSPDIREAIDIRKSIKSKNDTLIGIALKQSNR